MPLETDVDTEVAVIEKPHTKFSCRKLLRQLQCKRMCQRLCQWVRNIPHFLWIFFIDSFVIPAYRPEWAKYTAWQVRPTDDPLKQDAVVRPAERKKTLKKRKKLTDMIANSSVPKPVNHNHALCQIVTINVSGKVFQTQMRTLLLFPNTLLGDATRLAQFYDPERDDYFLDRNRTCFESILYFYQSRGILRRPSTISLELFEEEIRFYDLGLDVMEKLRREEGLLIDIEKPVPKSLLQRKFWLLFEYPESSKQARIVAVLSIVVVLISISIFCVETLRDFQRNAGGEGTHGEDEFLVDGLSFADPFFFTESVCMMWFVFEFLIRILSAPRKMAFIKEISNIIDLCAILPFFITISITINTNDKSRSHNKATSLTVFRVVRLVRVFRILKLSRHNKGLKVLGKTLRASIRELGLLVFFLGIGVVLFSSAVYFADLSDPHTHFKSIIDAFWWSVITMTTCGYGDLVPVNIRLSGWENVQEVQIKHPRTGVNSAFLLETNLNSKKGGSGSSIALYEVLTMQQDTRSWFIDNSVVSDGSVLVCTAVDPLFLALPILAKSDKAKPLADHLHESSLPKHVADILSKNLSMEQLENISIKKGCDDIVAFVYSEEKTVSWLKTKAEKVAKFLSSKNISHAENSVSSNFVKVDSVSEEDSLRYACDIVGEYVDEALKRSLLEKLNLPVLEKSGGKRKSVLEPEDDNSTNSNKKTKVAEGEVHPLEDYGSATPMTPVNKNTNVTAREKQLQKAAQGSHSLLKFFTPKTK